MTNTNETHAPTFTNWDEYERAYREHSRDAASVLNQLIGAANYIDRMQEEGTPMSDWYARTTLDHYINLAREWDAQRPEWVQP